MASEGRREDEHKRSDSATRMYAEQRDAPGEWHMSCTREVRNKTALHGARNADPQKYGRDEDTSTSPDAKRPGDRANMGRAPCADKAKQEANTSYTGAR